MVELLYRALWKTSSNMQDMIYWFLLINTLLECSLLTLCKQCYVGKLLSSINFDYIQGRTCLYSGLVSVISGGRGAVKSAFRGQFCSPTRAAICAAILSRSSAILTTETIFFRSVNNKKLTITAYKQICWMNLVLGPLARWNRLCILNGISDVLHCSNRSKCDVNFKWGLK